MTSHDVFCANATLELERIAMEAGKLYEEKYRNEFRNADLRYILQLPTVLFAAASGLVSLLSDSRIVPALLAFLAAAGTGLNTVVDPTRRRAGNKRLAARALDLQHRALRVVSLQIEPGVAPERRPVLEEVIEQLAAEETLLRSTLSNES